MMRMRVRWWSVGVVIVALGSGAAASRQSNGDLLLTLSAVQPALRTGDAVLVSVEASSPLMTLEGEVFGRPVPFWSSADRRQWRGLIGVDMEVSAGTYGLDVRATSERGKASGRLSLLVAKRRFETRRIRVEERFVNPPAEEIERIQKEARRLADVMMQSESTRFWRGAFAAPVPGPATSSFGRLTVMNDAPRGRHRGVDFRAAEGTPVRAPNAGLVVLAEDLYFTGNTVVVDHGAGMVSLFAHFSEIAVTDGMRVSAGDLLGQSGSTGRVTGPHLHWAMRLSGANIDPMSLIAALDGVSEAAF
jgi:murein DD-endopeptidase MepM/ murein hydrolase activator NlpD